MDRFQHFNSGRAIFLLLTVLTVIVFGAVLKITAVVVLPFTVAMLLAMVTSPIIKFMERFRIPRIVSIFLIVIILLGGLFFIGMLLYTSGRTIITLYPRYEARITEIYIWVARFFELPYDEHLSIFDNLWGQIGVRNRVRIMTLSFSNAFIQFLSYAVIVAIFMVFLLYEAVYIRQKLNRAFEGKKTEQIRKMSSDIMTQVSRYLSIKFFISLANGIIMGVGLMIIGVEFAVVWGVLQFIANFIPNFGSIVIGLAATLFSLIQFWPEPGPVVATALVILCMNLILSYIVDPKVTGDNLGLSPLIILLSLLIWGWIWGFTGLIIAVPMMVIIKIICENIPMLEPVSILLGSRKAALASSRGEEPEELAH